MEIAEEPGYAAVRALDPKTGEKAWDFELVGKPWSGVMSTAGNIVFAGQLRRLLLRSSMPGAGKELWHIYLGGAGLGGLGGAAMSTAPISYLSNGKQLVTMSSGHGVFTFELREVTP